MRQPIVSFCAFTLFLFIALTSDAAPSNGPLRVCKENQNYFCDQDGKAILLTGSHTWYNLVDMGPSDPPPAFDYPQYITWMEELNHNFMRMWAWDLTQWDTSGNGANNRNEHTRHFVAPLPWLRTGPGEATDGKPKFDLSKFNPEYFNRLRERVAAAGQKGIYVSIMFFEGWGLQHVNQALDFHPFALNNNINGTNGDTNGDGKGLEIHELGNDKVLEIQKAYIREVIDQVNDLDNVLYEISNENHPPSTEWQYHLIRFIKQYESTKPVQHPVGMTFQYKGGKNKTLFDSPADWISPNNDGGYRDNPPANTGKKVVISDTDHLWGIGGYASWAWKSACRGLNPIFMDTYDAVVLGQQPFDEKYAALRRALGDIRKFTARMDLNASKPMNELSNTGYCLADSETRYLVFVPQDTKNVEVEMPAGEYTVEWLNVETSKIELKDKRLTSNSKMKIENPVDGPAALFIEKK
ncbi:MAG: DUF6298 domain-containing protein [Candidatus Hinthialibacter antarcticus]|nr:DUF6298 domain-containing protein [Candidatus Hinthialibacter antarcticus]